MIYPKEYLNSVKDISIELLNKNNIKGLILDVDNTLISLDKKMPAGIVEWVKNIKANGIKICILSNSNKIDKVEAVAKLIESPYIFFGKKPLKSGFLRAQNILKLKISFYSFILIFKNSITILLYYILKEKGICFEKNVEKKFIKFYQTMIELL